jgi:hypothetical protein
MKASTQFVVIAIVGTHVIPVQKIMQKGPELFVLTDMNGMNLYGFKKEKSVDAFFINGKTKK